MYCYTLVNNINCTLNELILWCDISSEHPIFAKSMAQLTGKDLPPNIIQELDGINKTFSALREEADAIRKRISINPCLYSRYRSEIRNLIGRFLAHDKHVLQVLPLIREIGKDDKVWQTLLEHVAHEQTFMYETFSNISSQVMV